MSNWGAKTPPTSLPPPPPPPPPPPCGPEEHAGGGDRVVRGASHCRSRMRNFNWDTIPLQSVLGKRNVWTARRALEDFQLDTKRMEELFGHGEAHPLCLQSSSRIRKTMWGPATPSPDTHVVAILGSKRSMNISIFLKQFRRPIREIVSDIRQGNWMAFGTGKLKELCKLLPEEGEVHRLMAFTGTHSLLTEADLFMVLLVKVPSYEERLRSMVLQEEFFPLMEEMKRVIDIMTTAANELLDCDDLHSIIRLVLKAGNYLNAGGYAGSAIGFRMTSLLKLVDTKANMPGINLMHYVAMQAQEIDPGLLKFSEQLPHIGEASRISRQEIEQDFQREMEKIVEARMEAKKHPELEMQIQSFLKRAESQLAKVEASLQNLGAASHSVAEFFCEDPGPFKLEECCAIFHSFCDKFMRAVQENRGREVAEVKRRQQERCANKRRSTATCSSVDQDVQGVALEALLQTFLSSRGSRRRPGRSRTTAGSPVGRILEAGQGKSAERATSINDKHTPKGRVQRGHNPALHMAGCDSPLAGQSPVSLEEEDEEEEHEGQAVCTREVGKMEELSSRLLHYHNSLLHESPFHVTRSPGGAATPSAVRLRQTEHSPRTILSPRPSPKITPKHGTRRHSISVPCTALALEYGDLMATPRTPRHKPPLSLCGKMKSEDSFLSTPTSAEISSGPSSAPSTPLTLGPPKLSFVQEVEAPSSPVLYGSNITEPPGCKTRQVKKCIKAGTQIWLMRIRDAGSRSCTMGSDN